MKNLTIKTGAIMQNLKKLQKLQKLLQKIEHLQRAPKNHPSFDLFQKIATKAKSKIIN
jgi:hypothetical protein